ncbi:acyltransferase family protein [Listeria booriae]|uniref:Acyltransferase family protein n=1 Tax=Listeria booriae TaxID=1552123 RepID=A0A841ZWC4_9LIST|nr:acyltransferase family protein [Listeria booriae]MBC1564647.1 acyltransferase family protein [Listeria booriae]
MTKDVKLSNIKGILIFLVVLGHLLLVVRTGMEPLIVLIYSFHMPAFIFLNGYFAKNVTFKKVINLLLLYIIFQSFYAFITYFTHYSEAFTFRFTTPIFHLWYLISLACFYLVAISLNKIGKHRLWSFFIITGILVISIGIRWWATGFLVNHPQVSGQFFSIQRTFVFFPFFLLGFYIDYKTMNKCKTILYSFKFKLLGSSILIFGIVWLLSTNLLKFENAFYGFLQSSAFAINWRIFFEIEFQQYLIACIMLAILFALINQSKNLLTLWGDNSLVIFLFHPLFFFVLRMYTSNLTQWNIFLKLTFVICISLFVCSFLVAISKWLCWITNPLNTILQFRHDRNKAVLEE